MRRATRWLLALAVVALSASLLAGQVGGRTALPKPTAIQKPDSRRATAAPPIARLKPPKPFREMSLKETQAFQERALAVYVSRWHWWQTHRKLYSQAREACLGAIAPHWACWYLKASIWSKRELSETQDKVRQQNDWGWQAWLPDKYARVGACETGYGKRPGDWHWDSGAYVSAFGIARGAYAQFASYLGLPSWDSPGTRTPREQYLVAKAIHDRFGWSAWGCGGA